eukprot:8618197-Lingulodinium_polyedra.AAC.1
MRSVLRYNVVVFCIVFACAVYRWRMTSPRGARRRANGATLRVAAAKRRFDRANVQLFAKR